MALFWTAENWLRTGQRVPGVAVFHVKQNEQPLGPDVPAETSSAVEHGNHVSGRETQGRPASTAVAATPPTADRARYRRSPPDTGGPRHRCPWGHWERWREVVRAVGRLPCPRHRAFAMRPNRVRAITGPKATRCGWIQELLNQAGSRLADPSSANIPAARWHEKGGPTSGSGSGATLSLSQRLHADRGETQDRTSANSFSKNCLGRAPMTVLFTSPPSNR